MRSAIPFEIVRKSAQLSVMFDSMTFPATEIGER